MTADACGQRPSRKEAVPLAHRLSERHELCEADGVSSRQALVVGASSDIGRAVAVMLAREGHDVALWGRDRTRLLAAAREVDAVGRRSSLATVDVTDHEGLREQLARLLGGGPLHTVVWAAGVFDWAPADKADPVRWEHLISVNLTAAAVLTALVVPALVEAAPSVLVFIGSGASRRAYPNNAAYVASKHGLAGLANGTFLHVRDHEVKVSIVSPGLVAAGAGLLSSTGRRGRRTCCAPTTSRRPSASSSPSRRPDARLRSSSSPSAPRKGSSAGTAPSVMSCAGGLRRSVEAAGPLRGRVARAAQGSPCRGAVSPAECRCRGLASCADLGPVPGPAR